MSVNRTLHEVTERIMERSERTRAAYLTRMKTAAGEGPRRAHLTCGNQAHAYAAMGQDQKGLAEGHAPNIGIISAYNDMLSAHQPFAGFPDYHQNCGPRSWGDCTGCGWGTGNVRWGHSRADRDGIVLDFT